MLKSPILAGNARLDSTTAGGPSIKKAPPADDRTRCDAFRRRLVGTRVLDAALPPLGPTNEPDGKFGDETYRTVIAFQRREFSRTSRVNGMVGAARTRSGGWTNCSWGTLRSDIGSL